MSNTIRIDEAYAAMFDFIEQIFKRTNADALGALLGSMSTTNDGLPADPAIADEWKRSIDRAKKGEVKTGLML